MGRAELVGGIEEILNAQKDLLNGDTGLPVISEDREADGSAGEDVGVEEASRELAWKERRTVSHSWGGLKADEGIERGLEVVGSYRGEP